MSIVIGAFAQTNSKSYYLTTNLISPVAGLNKNNAAANVLVPLISNLEYGCELCKSWCTLRIYKIFFHTNHFLMVLVFAIHIGGE